MANPRLAYRFVYVLACTSQRATTLINARSGSRTETRNTPGYITSSCMTLLHRSNGEISHQDGQIDEWLVITF